MENIMTLHNDKSTFEAAVLSASERLQILPAFIEKDYWLTLVLKRLSESKFNDDVVFKGGTSLSKGYKLIDRFSEDIDIAIIEVDELPGNQLKNLIREVEKTISQDMIEIPNHIGTSKGSRFRKSYFMYPKIINDRLYQSVSDKLIIEINSFANPFPFEKMEISSLIFSSLLQSEKHELISKYGLTPFSVNVLSKSQTMLEKLVKLEMQLI
jgi:predicted nucleotidyltransferase component of viral defense system